ncbi:MAG: sialate O-acetylesterase [Sphingobium sp.]|uniref:sialate O-acetylesterase n=1 Tax=Sphingobium sp. TaxID=1912891 RepID=UPI003BAFF9E5
MPEIKDLPLIPGELTGAETIIVETADGTMRGTVADLVNIPAARIWGDQAEARALGAMRRQGGPIVSADDPALWVKLGNRRAPLMNRRGQLLAGTIAGTYGAALYLPGRTATYHHESRRDTAYVFVGLGQSNQQGYNAVGGELVGDAPIYPDNALMLSGGVRRAAGARGTSLVSLVEASDGPLQSTAMSGWVNHFIRDHEAGLGFNPTVVGFVAAIGGLPYMGLKRGTSAYSAFCEGLEDCVRLLRQRGFWRIVAVIDWMQGETDTSDIANMTATRYQSQLKQLARQLADDVTARTGNTETPVLFVDQIAMTVGGDPWTMPVRQAQVAIDGWDNIRQAGPIYCYPHVDDEMALHLTSAGQTRRGQQLARATLEEVLGSGWRGIRPIEAAFISATQIRIDFDAQTAPIVLDTSGAVIATAGNATHGFRFRDGSGAPPAISGVAAAGLSVTITLAAPPTGPRPQIGYAIERNAGSADGGPLTGARGTLRDSSAHESLYGDADQSNWCPAFILDVQGRAA